MRKYLSHMISCIKIEFIAGNTETRIGYAKKMEERKKVYMTKYDGTATPFQLMQCTNESDKIHKLNTIMYKLCYCRVYRYRLKGQNKREKTMHTKKKTVGYVEAVCTRGQKVWASERAQQNARNVLQKSLLTLHSINILRTVKKCAQHKWSHARRWSISARCFPFARLASPFFPNLFCHWCKLVAKV